MLEVAGNPLLMTTDLKATLADDGAGNYRIMMNLADELLAVAVERDLQRLDEKLYLDTPQGAAAQVLGRSPGMSHPCS